jgi:hypothetical protein
MHSAPAYLLKLLERGRLRFGILPKLKKELQMAAKSDEWRKGASKREETTKKGEISIRL